MEKTDVTDVAARDGILATNGRFMALVGAGDASGLADLYTEDAGLYPPHRAMITGAGDIVAFWQGAIDMGLRGARLETDEVDNEGDTAIETGRYRLTAADGSVADEGKYLVVWKRVDDAWFIHRDIWNTSLEA
jgi:ketosteroid isomerase-like protein